MSKYWAKAVDGLVVKVIVANDDFFETFIDDSAGTWIETKNGWFYKEKLCRCRTYI